MQKNCCPHRFSDSFWPTLNIFKSCYNFFSGDDKLKQLAFLKSLTLKMVELNVSSSV